MKQLNEYELEEREKQWYIDSLGGIQHYTRDKTLSSAECDFIEDSHLQIGNYFETEEEAEKAVEKLKAWQRLKESGFEFTKLDLKSNYICYKVGMEQAIDARQVVDDINYLFGGEE